MGFFNFRFSIADLLTDGKQSIFNRKLEIYNRAWIRSASVLKSDTPCNS